MEQPKKQKYIQPKYTMFGQAKEGRNRFMDLDQNSPASKQDSLDYKAGFNVGVRNKMTGKNARIESENVFQKMGRWEGQNHTFNNKDAQVISKKVGK